IVAPQALPAGSIRSISKVIVPSLTLITGAGRSRDGGQKSGHCVLRVIADSSSIVGWAGSTLPCGGQNHRAACAGTLRPTTASSTTSPFFMRALLLWGARPGEARREDGASADAPGRSRGGLQVFRETMRFRSPLRGFP